MLTLVRLENETWLQCALRYAKRYGMEEEVKASYDLNIKLGHLDESTCAYMSCEEWDILDYVDDDPNDEGQHYSNASKEM